VVVYRAYGLNVQSAVPLPILIGEGGVDVVVYRGKADPPPEWDPNRVTWVAIDRDCAVHTVPHVATFVIRDGNSICVDAAQEATDEVLALYLLAAVMALLLYQRRYLVLHASSVSINGAGILFLGVPGAGKSSLAAALIERGHALIADDLSVLSDSLSPLLLPGYPQVRVTGPVAGALGLPFERLHAVAFEDAKFAYRCPQALAKEPVPLRGVYLLTRGDSERVDPLPAKKALLGLLANAYVRFGKPKDGLDFYRAVEMVTNIPVSVVQRSDSLDEGLKRLAHLVEQDVVRRGLP